MLNFSRFYRGLAFAALFFGTAFSAHAQTAASSTSTASVSASKPSALDAAIEKIPLEKFIGQLLGAIDVAALSQTIAQGADKAATDIAAGKTPDVSKIEASPAMKEMQTKMQAQISQVAPELLRSLSPLIGLMLGELKKEFAESFKQ